MNCAGERKVAEKSDFRSDLVGALMVEGYDFLFARFVVDVLRLGVIDPFCGDFPSIRKALESLGVFDEVKMREKLWAE